MLGVCKLFKSKKKLISEPDEVEIGVLKKEKTNNQAFENQTAKVEINHINQPKSPKFIWGTLVANLRRLNLMTLHTACGEIRDIELNGNTLNVLVKEDYLYTILTKDNNFNQILDLLRQIEANIELKYILKKKPEDKIKINLEKLKNIFGEELIIK
ncbi:MAG: hypothetical protein IJW32_01850 [Clostridia bacterium]|nr:hypothetical protein [Clostridia bacterium]